MNKNLVILICFLLSPTICLGFDNEPDQFRGLKWGESFAGHGDFFLSDVDEIGRKVDFTESNPHAKIYKRKNDKRLIGKAEINDIFYKLYNDKLYYVRINYDTAKSYKLLYQTLLELHGKPDFTDDQGYTRWKEWRGRDINITLSYAQLMFQGRIIKIIGFIDYEFIPVSNEYSSDLQSYYREEDEKLSKQRKEQSKKTAKEAEKDLY
jgi:hypothetical protein